MPEVPAKRKVTSVADLVTVPQTSQEMRDLVAKAYEKARVDPTNYTQLPPWESVHVDVRCAFIMVFCAGGQYVLKQVQEAASDSVPKGTGV